MLYIYMPQFIRLFLYSVTGYYAPLLYCCFSLLLCCCCFFYNADLFLVFLQFLVFDCCPLDLRLALVYWLFAWLTQLSLLHVDDAGTIQLMRVQTSSEHNKPFILLFPVSYLGNNISLASTVSLPNPLGTGDLKFHQSQGLSTFSGLFLFLLNQSFICNGSQFSSLFTILQEHMSLWPQCNIVFLHHKVHDALNNITMTLTPPWCYKRGTYMSFQSLHQGWTYMISSTSFFRHFIIYNMYIINTFLMITNSLSTSKVQLIQPWKLTVVDS